MMDELIEWVDRQIRHAEKIWREEDSPFQKQVNADMIAGFKETAQALRELQSCREENERLRGKLGRIKAHCHHHKTMSKTLLRNTVQICYEEAAMTNPDLLRAPWTPEQIAKLDARQADETKHPYTCECGHSLEPFRDGWRCEAQCGYTQDWCLREDAE